MYKKNDKERLYWLINNFLNDKISAKEFCDEFYASYDLEIDFDTLTELEKVIFAELGNTTGRFSEYEEDIKKYPNTYFSRNQLKNQLTFIQKIFDSIGKCE